MKNNVMMTYLSNGPMLSTRSSDMAVSVCCDSMRRGDNKFRAAPRRLVLSRLRGVEESERKFLARLEEYIVMNAKRNLSKT